MSVSGHTQVRIEGTGPPVVLVHGVGLDHTMWDRVVPRLAAIRTTVRYDIWGHGTSVDPPGDRTLDDFVEQLVDVIDTHCGGCADVAGLSIGGLIARGAAIRHPDRITRLMLLNAVYNRSTEQRRANCARLELARAEGMHPIAELALDRWFRPEWQSANPELVATVRTRITTTPLPGYLKAYSVFTEGDPLVPAAIGQIAAPTLVVTGELDVGSTPEMTLAMAADIPDARAVVLPGLHHVPPIEDPAACTAPLLDFLTQETTP